MSAMSGVPEDPDVRIPDPDAQARTEAGPADGPLVELRGVEVHFAGRASLAQLVGGGARRVVRAVDGVDLTVGRGEIVALVGESGCGKTTTGRAVVGLVPVTGGSIRYQGAEVTRLKGRDLRLHRRRVQIIFQDPYESLNPKQAIRDIVAEPLTVQGLARGPERAARITRSLEDAGLRPAAAYLDRYPHELSGGQRQRVAIAAAMVLEPDLVVADEPVSMLDVSIRAGILRVMLELRERRGVGYLFITHDLSLAWVISDRIAVMYLGRIVELGPATRVVGAPQHPYTRALLSVMPSPDPKRRTARTILQGETPDAAALPSGCRFHPRCPAALAHGILERCRTQEPPVVPVAGGGMVACWLAAPDGAGSAPEGAPGGSPTGR